MRRHVVLVVVGVQPVVAVRQHAPIQGRRLEAINDHKRKPQMPTPNANTYNNKYRINRNTNSNTRYQSYRTQSRQNGVMSDFGRSLTRGIGWGAGWAIGNHMGNSLWHTMFGFGSNTYYDQNGQMQTQSGGYAGWVVLILVIVIIILIVKLLRRPNYYYRRHEY